MKHSIIVPMLSFERIARSLFLIFLVCTSTRCGSRMAEPTNGDTIASVVTEHDSLNVTRQAYTQAIATYISVNSADTLPRDTLYIGKHDQFPTISLPYTIQNAPVRLITNAEYEAISKYKKSCIYVNMIHTQKENHWSFKMVTFYGYAVPQHDFYVEFDYNPTVNDWAVDTLYFDYAYEKK